MAKIEYITGDLLASDEAVIAQGCNAQGVMGSGIAKLIRDRSEDVYTAYRNHCDQHLGEDIMGDVIPATMEDKVVMNIITQKFYGRDESIRYCSYDAIAVGFERLNMMASASGITQVGLPLIGAGLANGSWSVISAIIESEAKDFEPRVYLLDGRIPK